MPETKTLRFLLWAMSQPRTFYALGAGASYRLVPLAAQIGSYVKEEHYKIGIYPALRTQYSPFLDRVIGDIRLDLRDPHTFLLPNIAPGTLDLLVQRALLYPAHDVVPPQYAVFDLVGKPSTIFSFNLDGLASAYCRKKHIVLEPHGGIDRLWVNAADYQKKLYATSAYDLTLPHITPKWLAGPEPSGITGTAAYARGRELFALCEALVIIGYSFGRRLNTFDVRRLSIRDIMGGCYPPKQQQESFDDAESFEYVVDLLRTYPRPALVLSPDPHELVDLLQQRVHSRRIYKLPVRWEVLSTVLISMAGARRQIVPFWCKQTVDGFKRAYYSVEALSAA